MSDNRNQPSRRQSQSSFWPHPVYSSVLSLQLQELLGAAPDHGSTNSRSRELHRAIERFHRNIDRVRSDLSTVRAAVVEGSPSMSTGSDRDLRRRFNRDPLPPNAVPPADSSSVLPNPSSLPPLRSLGSRSRPSMAATGSGSRLSRYHQIERGNDARSHRDVFSYSYLDDANQADDPDTQIQAFFDSYNLPLPGLLSPTMSPQTHTPDHTEENRRFKRRKLDSDKPAPAIKAVRYGKYGAIEPGQLNMEIVSCDGGLFQDELTHPPENILKNDRTVYCTKGNRCNIVLRHQGGTVFSLKELIIKAPGPRFSDPYVPDKLEWHMKQANHPFPTASVREGLVFVSMKSDELLTRTAQYQIQYQPRNAGRSCPLPTIFSVHHDEEGSSVTRMEPRAVHDFLDDDDENYRTAQIPPEFNVPPPPFNITTECDNDDSEAEAGSGHYHGGIRPRRRTPRIGTLPFEGPETSDEEAGWGNSSAEWATFDYLTRRPQYQPLSSRRGAMHSGDSGGMTLEEAQEASQLATQEAVRAVGGTLMAPLAHFFIDKNKNKCTIRFDPPVSGRFLLLKMWSPHDPGDRSKNIDIKAVIARGFAGPRYVPAIQLS